MSKTKTPTTKPFAPSAPSAAERNAGNRRKAITLLEAVQTIAERTAEHDGEHGGCVFTLVSSMAGDVIDLLEDCEAEPHP